MLSLCPYSPSLCLAPSRLLSPFVLRPYSSCPHPHRLIPLNPCQTQHSKSLDLPNRLIIVFANLRHHHEVLGLSFLPLSCARCQTTIQFSDPFLKTSLEDLTISRLRQLIEISTSSVASCLKHTTPFVTKHEKEKRQSDTEPVVFEGMAAG